jgi:hypothetical protein
MSNEFIKVSQGDGRNQNIDVRGVKPINNIKVIRPDEESLSSEQSDSDYSSISEDLPKKKRTKKVLRKKENYQQHAPKQQNFDFSAFSNPKKISQQQSREYQDTESEYTESEPASEEYSDDGSEEARPTESFEEKQKMKQDLLIKIAALEKKGFEFTKKFTMASNYEEMMFEYNKVKTFIETQAGIKFARRCLMACVTGIEFLNKKFDPFAIRLEGWSENVMENVDDYDNVFERLYEKYSQKAEVAPEIELLLMVGGSAFMFHLTNSLLKSPAMGGLLAQNGNPGQQQNFMASMMGAMSQGMKEMGRPPNQQNAQQRPNFPPPVETRGIRKEMRGPSIDASLFNGTPLASNYPSPPPQFRQQPPQQPIYYDENPINDEDRFSIASSDDSSISTVSLGSTVKTLNVGNKKQKGKTGGVELNIK